MHLFLLKSFQMVFVFFRCIPNYGLLDRMVVPFLFDLVFSWAFTLSGRRLRLPVLLVSPVEAASPLPVRTVAFMFLAPAVCFTSSKGTNQGYLGWP